MMLPSIPFVVLDTETTGFVPRTHKVIEFASVEVREGKQVKEYEQLFFHKDVPPVVQVLTRIKTPNLQGKPQIAERMEEILSHLPEDALIIGQNISFDIGMLKGEGIDLENRPWVDTSMLASIVFPELESYSLGYLSTVLKLNHDPPHRALGDVRATLELLGKCWERLLELPDELRSIAFTVMERAPAGYRMLFSALPESKARKEPRWLHAATIRSSDHLSAPLGTGPTIRSFSLSIPSSSPALLDEPLDPVHLQAVIEGALKDSSTRHWIAVKNLRTSVLRMPKEILKRVRILYPPHTLIDPDAVKRFAGQSSYTADEATLALKLAWYEPLRRDEFPLHGGEEAVWNGKLSCTETSKEYLAQFESLPSVVLIDHRGLLEFLEHPDHPGAKTLAEGAHVIIDDASMLEDTATKAFGWYCAMDDIRAAAQGQALLTRFTDTLQLWVEKVRQFQDIRYLAKSDLGLPETKGIRSLLEEVLQQKWPDQLLRHLESFQFILNSENLPHRIVWIEQKPNGSQSLHSVPERIGQLLHDQLFSRFPTTLMIPQGSSGMLPEILPPTHTPIPNPHPHPIPIPHPLLPISYDVHPTLEELLTSLPPGKTIILLPGKSPIEDLYVKYAENLEKAGVKMISQGVSGGMGRMTAEFLAEGGERSRATAVVWLLTPWMFEGVDLPTGTISHLVMKTLPFDHPSHPVLSRRCQNYRDPFNDYTLPRTLHRLFRLLRTYARMRTSDGDVRILDDRVTTKEYGKRVKTYLEQFSSSNDKQETQETKETEDVKPKKSPKKKSEDQLTMF